MRLPHLLEGSKQIVQVLGLCRIAEYLFEGLIIRMLSRRQPKRGAAEVGGHISGVMCEAAPRELTSSRTHGAEVFVRRWPRESGDGVREKRRNYSWDGVWHLIGCRTSYLDRRTGHLFLPEPKNFNASFFPSNSPALLSRANGPGPSTGSSPRQLFLHIIFCRPPSVHETFGR